MDVPNDETLNRNVSYWETTRVGHAIVVIHGSLCTHRQSLDNFMERSIECINK